LPWLVFGAAGVVELWGRYFPGIPRPVVVGAIVVGFAVNAVLFVRNKLVPWMEDQP
jgi:multisubunit Na+/H+ antiporter MnhC subunit